MATRFAINGEQASFDGYPGTGRTPAPGTRAQFDTLIQAWIDGGAKCPSE